MSDIVLYAYWRSSASYRVRIALGLKGLSWTSVPIDLLNNDHRGAAHRSRNPQGFVPVMEIDGLVLTQSLAMIDYLDETRPEPALLPADPAGRARVRALAHVVAVDVAPVNNSGVLEHVEAVTNGGQAARLNWMEHFIPQGMEAFETLLDHPATGRFCHGDAPTLADICLVPQVYNAMRWGIDLSQCPRLLAIADDCGRLDAFSAAYPDNHKPLP